MWRVQKDTMLTVQHVCRMDVCYNWLNSEM